MIDLYKKTRSISSTSLILQYHSHLPSSLEFLKIGRTVQHVYSTLHPSMHTQPVLSLFSAYLIVHTKDTYHSITHANSSVNQIFLLFSTLPTQTVRIFQKFVSTSQFHLNVLYNSLLHSTCQCRDGNALLFR